MFLATTSDRSGRLRQIAKGETRVEAARAVFAIDPKAEDCCTSVGYLDADSKWQTAGMDMRWHKRRDTGEGSATGLTVTMRAIGNPDFGQDTTRPFAPTETATVRTVAEAQQEVRSYIERHDLGGGNFLSAPLRNASGNHLGMISYNGRWWPGQAETLPADIRRIFDPEE